MSVLGDDRVKVTEDICRRGAGGQEDLAFLNSKILSYYYSSPGWLAGPLPTGQKYLHRRTIPLLILLEQAGKRRKTRLSASATRIRTTTVTQNTVKKWGIVLKAWQVA